MRCVFPCKSAAWSRRSPRLWLAVLALWLGWGGVACNPEQEDPQALSNNEVVLALEQMMGVCADTAANRLGARDAYYEDPAREVPLPSDIQAVELQLRNLSTGVFLLDDLRELLNRSAERSAPLAAPILKAAADTLQIQDGWSVLLSSDTAALAYLVEFADPDIQAAYARKLDSTFAELGGPETLNRLVDLYNAWAALDSTVQPQSLNVELQPEFAAHALAPIYAEMAQYERRMRVEPTARPTFTLERVLGVADAYNP